jgi:hypothetical protein
MRRHTTLRALLLSAASLGLPIACGLGIDDQQELYPPPYALPPTFWEAKYPCSGDVDCPLGLVCTVDSCSSTGLCSNDGECLSGFFCHPTRQTCTPIDRSPGGTGGMAGASTDGDGPDLGGSTAGTGGVSGVAGSAGAAGVGGSVGDGVPGFDAGTSQPPAAADAGTCPTSGECEQPAPCLTNDECTDGLCVNNACRSFCSDDAECADGEGCVLGLCRADAEGLECIAAADCPDSDDCVGGSCLRRCLSAEHCVGCDDGPSCNLGYCGP